MQKRFKKVLSLLLCFVMLSSLVSMFGLTASAASNDVLGIDTNTVYYIKNIFNGKYLDVYNGGDSNGTDVWTYTFNATPAQQWRAVRNSDGTYTFYAIVSANNRVLDVTGTNVDIWTYSSSLNCQKFSLVRNTTLAYGGTYQIKNGSNYVIYDVVDDTVEVSSTGNGLNALWSFETVDKGDADIYTFYYENGSVLWIFPTHFDTRGAASTFVEKCENMGYTGYHFTNKSASTAYSYMRNDSIWVFNGHGVSAADTGDPLPAICFFDDSGQVNGHIFADSSSLYYSSSTDVAINSYSNNTLADAQCVLYIGCSTGKWHDGHNLVNATFNRGAHFALGTTQTIYTNESEKWIKKFFEKADTSATIRECLDHANYYQSLGLLYYEGDVYKKLK